MTRDDESASAFQAIGHYVYEFSWLCWDMKQALASVPGLTGPAYTTIQMIAGEMTAAPLADACFALCEEAVQGGPEAVKMVRTLRAQVLKEVSRRNDLLHGDWMIGWVANTGVERPDGTVEQITRDLPPTLTRVKPGRSGAQKKTEEEIAVTDLEAEAGRLRTLRHTVEDFLRLIEGRAVALPGIEVVSLQDVYALKKGELTRSGPRASEVPRWRNH